MLGCCGRPIHSPSRGPDRPQASILPPRFKLKRIARISLSAWKTQIHRLGRCYRSKGSGRTRRRARSALIETSAPLERSPAKARSVSTTLGPMASGVRRPDRIWMTLGFPVWSAARIAEKSRSAVTTTWSLAAAQSHQLAIRSVRRAHARPMNSFMPRFLQCRFP